MLLGQGIEFWLDIAIALAVVALVLCLAQQQRRRRYRQEKMQKKIAEHRFAAHYLDADPDDIEDSTPYVQRARWAIILSTLSIIGLLYIVFMSE